MINGEEVLLPRGNPKLIDGALPSEYPELPIYYTKKLPKKRNPKCREPNTKKAKIEINNGARLDENTCPFSDPILPSKYWTKISFPNRRNFYAFALWTDINTNMPVHLILKPERLVVIKELENKTGCCSIYINDCMMVKEKVILHCC